MPIEKLLLETFKISDKEAWQTAAAIELNGADPFSLLRWQTPDGLSFAPYYNNSDADQLTFLQKFHLGYTTTEYSCINMPHVTVHNNESLANAQALEHLLQGADGIIFSLQGSDTNFDLLLQKIEWPYCALFFIVDHNFLVKGLEDYISKKYINEKLTGAIFWKEASLQQQIVKINNLKSFGVLVTPSTPTDEITNALLQAVQLIYRLQQTDTTETIINNIAFSIPIGNNFLIEISKLKALRILWYQVTQAFEIKNYKPDQLYIHARSEVWQNEAYEPHGNMLKSTIATMAAISGGCNAYTAFAEDETGIMINRVARNNALILLEESHFAKVADPFAGSYVIENMVNEIATAAWEKFKNQIQ